MPKGGVYGLSCSIGNRTASLKCHQPSIDGLSATGAARTTTERPRYGWLKARDIAPDARQGRQAESKEDVRQADVPRYPEANLWSIRDRGMFLTEEREINLSYGNNPLADQCKAGSAGVKPADGVWK